MSEKNIAAANALYAYARDNANKTVWFVFAEDAEAYHRFNQMRVIAQDEMQSMDIVRRKITLYNHSTIQFMGKTALQLHMGEKCNFAAFQGKKDEFSWTRYVLPALYRDPDPFNKRHLLLEV